MPAFALVVTALLAVSSCGEDASGPNDDELGTAIITLSGALNRTDTTSAIMLPIMRYEYLEGETEYSVDIGFVPRTMTNTASFRGREFPAPSYMLMLSIVGSGEPGPGTLAMGNGVEGLIMDSLAFAQFRQFLGFGSDSQLPPSYMLHSQSGSVTLETVADSVFTGSFHFTARDETGRAVTATGKFRAIAFSIPRDSLETRGPLGFPFFRRY